MAVAQLTTASDDKGSTELCQRAAIASGRRPNMIANVRQRAQLRQLDHPPDYLSRKRSAKWYLAKPKRAKYGSGWVRQHGKRQA